MRNILATLFIILAIYSCNSNTQSSEDALLRKNVEKSICTDIRELSHKAVDGISMGVGSMVINNLVSESQQDSMIMKPFLPILKEELKLKNKNELIELSNKKSKRFALIGNLMLKNKELIISKVNDTYTFAAPLVEKAIEEAQTIAKEQN